jgi:hypothetical protein
MFYYDYDDMDKCFRITHADGRTRDVTEQGLYDFYVFNRHGINKSFTEVVNDLRNGHLIHGEDYDFDWNLGVDIYKGKLFIEPIGRVQKSSPPQQEMFKREYGCSHPRKYINSAGGVRFYVCPDCKRDLGDA